MRAVKGQCLCFSGNKLVKKKGFFVSVKLFFEKKKLFDQLKKK